MVCEVESILIRHPVSHLQSLPIHSSSTFKSSLYSRLSSFCDRTQNIKVFESLELEPPVSRKTTRLPHVYRKEPFY